MTTTRDDAEERPESVQHRPSCAVARRLWEAPTVVRSRNFVPLELLPILSGIKNFGITYCINMFEAIKCCQE